MSNDSKEPMSRKIMRGLTFAALGFWIIIGPTGLIEYFDFEVLVLLLIFFNPFILVWFNNPK